MRKVPPGIQIIPSVCEAPTVASALNVLAGKSVVILRAASRIDRQIARDTLGRSAVTSYWTVVQHRSDPASVTGTDRAAPARMNCAAATWAAVSVWRENAR